MNWTTSGKFDASLPSAVSINEAERITGVPEKQQPRIVLHAIPNGKFNILIVDPAKDPRIARPIFPDMTDIEIREYCRSRWPVLRRSGSR